MNSRAPILALVLLAAACSPSSTSTCSPETCGGCCDTTGVCQPGDTVGACGGLGYMCDTCVGAQSCNAGYCGEATTADGGTGTDGGTCTPTTCEAQNKNCGTIDDGCGAQITCGTCSGSLTCGGSGLANVCGVMCQMSCPAGYSCNALGACAGGTPNMLALDVKTVKVSGTVTFNGAAIANVGTVCMQFPTQPKVSLVFADRTRGYTVDFEIPCSNAGSTFSLDLFPGTYEVRASGHTGTDLPRTFGVINPALTVSAPIAAQVLDIKAFNVSGAVTINGAQPVNVGTLCNTNPDLTKAYVSFRDATSFAETRVPVLCPSASFAFSAYLFPGTYAVRVDGSTFTNLPDQNFTVAEGFVVNAAVAGKVFDVKTVTVSGKVTLNGAVPANMGSNCNNYPNDIKAVVSFTDANFETIDAQIKCSVADYAFSAVVAPGTYKVRVRGSQYSTLPVLTWQSPAPLVVTAAVSGQVLDVNAQAVTGNVTLNGSTPSDVGTRCNNYPSDTKAFVTFIDKDKNYAFTINIPCSSNTYAFTGSLFPGNYEVRTHGTQYSNIPEGGFLSGQLAVAGPVPGQVFDVKTLAISGTVTLNGAAPTDIGTECLNHPNDVKATVEFTDKARGHVITADVPCSSASFAFGTAIYPGTYDIRVKGTNRSTLPAAGFQIAAARTITAGMTGQLFDVKTSPVAGKVLLNSAVPMNVGNNCFMYPNDIKAVVTFTDPAKGYALSTNVLCGSADFAFNTALFPGTYEIRVKGTEHSNLPEAGYLAVQQLAVQ